MDLNQQQNNMTKREVKEMKELKNSLEKRQTKIWDKNDS